MNYLEDRQALTDRLASGMDIDALQILFENQPEQKVDTSRIYCRWVIDPAGTRDIENGPNAMTQNVGTAILQVIAPVGLYTEDAYAVSQQFYELFHNWRSNDKAIIVLGFSDNKRNVPYDKTTEEAGYLQLNTQFAWRSHRRRGA